MSMQGVTLRTDLRLSKAGAAEIYMMFSASPKSPYFIEISLHGKKTDVRNCYEGYSGSLGLSSR
jgi:hypothetical protein